MPETAEEIVAEAVREMLRPPPLGTLSLHRPVVRLLRPAAAHADWRDLPGRALAALFAHLLALDLFRLGYLFSPRWRDAWRASPLELHDRQFACLPIPVSDVADAITNVLEEYVDGEGEGGEGGGGDAGIWVGEGIYGAGTGGRVLSFRVESTEWRPDHAARWCTALKRDRALEVVLFNRGFADEPPLLVPVPPGLRECTTVIILDLGFVTVEAGELDALTGIAHLGLHGCACRPGVVEGVIAACRGLVKLSVHHGSLDLVAVRSAPSLRHLSMYQTAARRVTVDDAPLLRGLVAASTGRLCISRAPALGRLTLLNLAASVPGIEGAEVAVGVRALHPQMRSVTSLMVILDYAALGAMAPLLIDQILRRFPCVNNLAIERKDDVSQAEGLASRGDADTYQRLYNGLECVTRHLDTLLLMDFRGGKAELALAKALLHKAQVLQRVVLVYGDRRPGIRSALEEAGIALRQFVLRSLNQRLKDNPFILIFQPIVDYSMM